MRKRAQRRGLTEFDQSRYIEQPAKPTIEKKTFKPFKLFRKKGLIALSLILIFLLVLFFNTYFNLTSGVVINPNGQGFDRFYFSGPDPYYNLRLVEGTYETGKYPYYYEPDPLLKYPIGEKGGRAPLFNMLAIGFSRFLTPFMNEADAIGYSMQFLPALYGALLIFVVYFIGKELFNYKAGLIAAMFVAIIPIHLSSGHGSSYGLFDHDSFLLLMFFLVILFLIKSIKEENSTKSLLYAIIGGVCLAATSLVWVEAEYYYAVIGIYAILQMLIDIFTNKIETRVFRATSVTLFIGYIISMPVVSFSSQGFSPDVPLYICIVVIVFGALYYIFGIKKIPWTLSLPAIFSAGVVGLVAIYFSDSLARSIQILSPLLKLRGIIFGTGIYGDKVSMTIAEANTYNISNTVMSFGPALYWIGWLGFGLLCYYYYKNKQRKEYLFIAALFLIDIWLTHIAGRFINDMVPVIAVLAGWVVWFVIDHIDYKQMLKNIRGAGGGLHGIRKGIKFLHIFGILFIVFIVILPNAYVAFDAALPQKPYKKADGNWTTIKLEMFGDTHRGAYGLSASKEIYWTDALDWLRSQDTNISDPVKRPAFISWWDYGFYEAALGGHPTVADNFQDGIPTAANFQTSTSEGEAVSVWITRLLEGDQIENNVLSEKSVQILTKYLGENNSKKVEDWINSAGTSAPSYGAPIGAAYDVNTSKKYPVGQQYTDNAAYHDIADLLTGNLTDEQITQLYHDIQEATGWSIRYYGVEGYDKQIFNIFSFLSDKSLLLVNGIGDDFVKLQYKGYTVDSQGQKLQDMTWDADQIINMSRDERRYVVITGTNEIYKDPYFDTMFYRTYIGPSTGASGSKQEFNWQVPCINMKHFYAEYFSNLSNPELIYPGTSQGAVVIARYYEGAYVNGTVLFNGQPINNTQVVVQKNLTFTPTFTRPIDHDKANIIFGESNSDGHFSLIAGAGSEIQIRRYPEIVLPEYFIYGFPLKNITFDSKNDSTLYPISDDDAMRRSNNYERNLGNITIEPGNIEGYLYNDLDNDSNYTSNDTALGNVDVLLYEVDSFDQKSFLSSGQLVPLDVVAVPNSVKTDNVTGHYSLSGLLPGYYIIQARSGDFLLRAALIEVYSGNMSYNMSKPKPGAVKGNVYYDKNGNGNYDVGEEIGNTNVTLYYIELGSDKLINQTVTDSNGYYSFDSLIPGAYKIEAVESLNYKADKEINITENQTLLFNVSMDLYPVTVSGFTKYNGTGIENINITFTPDELVENNTAILQQTDSIGNGFYSLQLTPGSYNVSISTMSGETLVYSFVDKLSLFIGQGSKPHNDISMSKISSTVSGLVSFNSKGVGNISIYFEPDGAIQNNTAVLNYIVSNETGYYSVELAPGSYDVTVNQTVNESGVNVTYVYSGKLVIKDNSPLPSNNIILAKET